jgi:hypothetical protein
MIMREFDDNAGTMFWSMCWREQDAEDQMNWIESIYEQKAASI